MSVIAIIVLTVIVLAVVIALGVLIVRLQRRAQTAVPGAADRRAAAEDRAVAVDAGGRPVLESQDLPAEPARDPSAFEQVLSESLDDLHRQVPPGDGPAPS